MGATLSRAEARRLLVAHLGLTRVLGRGARGTRAVLERLRCIQLDPLDVIGTNADLVVMARTDGVARGDVWRHLFPRRAFEHFAKERCILPAHAFPYYRRHGHEAETPWWQHGERERRVAPQIVTAVLDEIRRHGPMTARELTDHGSVEPLDWSGWMGTSKATQMALEILWTRCDIVVAGRTESGQKIYDIPERAFGAQEPPAEEFPRWALRERARAAGLLTRAGGSMWSMLSRVRTSGLVDELLEAGELVEVAIEETTRRYLAAPDFLEQKRVRYDDRVRLLGPLDPLLWDRELVRHVFGFDYVWEVYKPAHQRRWGWYVCPLLHRDRLIGRVDAQTSKLWLETADVDRDALSATLARYGLRVPRRSSR
ncbi:MAG TPA: crosslink repair DNA glycosylase YcaQ family protein [Thermoanaerobaculia bacterium]|nr:crosslink repair DNA glycosylase YcaQ family protein [Thermoanaerobaculia bacterium]